MPPGDHQQSTQAQRGTEACRTEVADTPECERKAQLAFKKSQSVLQIEQQLAGAHLFPRRASRGRPCSRRSRKEKTSGRKQ
jgi:hypothetical protein